jgi:hypothetical protein
VIAGRWLGPAFLASGCALRYALLEPRAGRRAALAAAPVRRAADRHVAGRAGQADLPLAILLLSAAGALAHGRIEGDPGEPLPAPVHRRARRRSH